MAEDRDGHVLGKTWRLAPRRPRAPQTLAAPVPQGHLRAGWGLGTVGSTQQLVTNSKPNEASQAGPRWPCGRTPEQGRGLRLLT